MNFIENAKEAMKAIKDNLLRTSLTAAIIAIGITALVGILTAVDALQSSITEGLSDLGGTSFDIRDQRYQRNRGGVQEARKADITYRECLLFKEKFEAAKRVSINASVAYSFEVKHLSKKTNPNSQVMGIDEYYLNNKGYEVVKGREFSLNEIRSAANVAIIGDEIANVLFENANPVGKEISVKGLRYMIVGVLEKSGGLGGGRTDRTVYLPLENAVRYSATIPVSYLMTITVDDPSKIDFLMGEATGVMRVVRKDELSKNSSFEIERSESVVNSINETSSSLRIGGSLVGIITLIGASIGLMNIMLVSVTERTREIGIRKALGATPARIREQFLVEAVVICLIGGVVGVVFGIGIGNLVTLLFDNSGFVFPLLWIILGFGVCVVVGIASGYYPARKASRLDPIESLRYE